uniref:Uncharacterized protein n=1 Tax=Macaca fascicularis TaxID=9541 RepID=A0A7N9CPS9_MACFA
MAAEAGTSGRGAGASRGAGREGAPRGGSALLVAARAAPRVPRCRPSRGARMRGRGRVAAAGASGSGAAAGPGAEAAVARRAAAAAAQAPGVLAHEDFMYDIIQDNKQYEKDVRIQQLKQLLEDSTSDEDGSSSSSSEDKEKHKKKKRKEKHKKRKKEKKKKKKRKHKSSKSNESSDSE